MLNAKKMLENTEILCKSFCIMFSIFKACFQKLGDNTMALESQRNT